MKAIITKILFIFLFSVFVLKCSAQYSTGIGFKYGDPGKGLTVIQYFAPKSRGAADLLISYQYKGFNVTGLYEIHSKNHNVNIEVANVGFYIGLGAHAGRSKGRNTYKNDTRDNNSVEAGIDVIGGIEWKLPHLPLLLSGDLKPFYNFTGAGKTQLNYLEYAVSLRFLF